MERRSVTLRGSLLNGTSRLGFGRARIILVPMLTGAAMAMGGISFTTTPAAAAAAIFTLRRRNGSQGHCGEGNLLRPRHDHQIVRQHRHPETSNVVLDTSTSFAVVISGGAGNGIQVDASAHNVGISDTVLTTPEPRALPAPQTVS
jgi:hypothetical protein